MLSSQVLGNNEAAITPRVRKVLRGAFRVASSWRPCCSSRRTVCPIMQREFFYPNVFGVRSADRCSSCAWNILDHCSLSRSASFFFGMSHSDDYSETLLHQDSAVAVDNIQHFFFFLLPPLPSSSGDAFRRRASFPKQITHLSQLHFCGLSI